MKKIALLSMVLVLVLGGLGVAYAMWSDTLTLGGTISTDDVCVMFTDDFGSDDDLYQGYPDPYEVPPPSGYNDHTVTANHDYVYPADPKDVGYTLVTKEDDNTLVVELHNVYPCYAVKIDSHVRNCGSVPVVKGECTITYLDEAGAPTTVPLPDFEWTTIYGPGKEGGMGADGYYPVIEIAWQNGTGDQLDPHSWGGIADEEDSFYIHVLQPALQNHTYTFTISRTAWNWNED
jgi:hypothetical protein